MASTCSDSEEFQRLARALRTLSGCHRALLRASDEPALLREICRLVVEEAGYRLARIGRAEQDADQSVTVLAQAGLDPEAAEVAALRWSDTEQGRSATGQAIRSGQPCVIRDALGEPFPPLWRDFCRRNGIGSVLSLPLRIQGEVFGALTIAAPETDAFNGSERQVLDEVADDLAFGLEVLRLRQHREHAEGELRRLHRALRTRASVNRALAQARDETALLHEICRVVVDDCRYELAWVAYVGEDGGLRPVAQAGCGEAQMAPRRRWGATEAARAVLRRLQGGGPVILRDLQRNAAYPFPEEARERGYGAVVVLPLSVEGALVGSLHIVALDADAFDAQEVELLLATTADLGYGLGALRQRTRAAAAEAEMRRMALFDAVTGLPNREQLRALLDEAIAAARREHRPLAFLRIGLEHFREINETLGSAEVDAFVRAVAQRLEQAVGAAGRLGRLLEGELAVLLPRAGAEPARVLAHKLLTALYEPIEIAGLLLDARASVGFSLFPGHGTDPDALMRRAGIALTQARGSGNCVALFKGGLDSECAQRMALMSELRGAIERDELMLWCQPKLQVRSGQVCGAEALVRWKHPRLGMVSPGDFIRHAENTGLITPLTYWMLDAALRQLYAWHEQGELQPLSVNLSARDLHDPKLLERVEGALATWGADPAWIEFELTESALMLDPTAALETLARLKRLELRLAIDDYGTGYSSLAYLRQLPVDSLKIDQSFVSGMQRDRGCAAIVHSTIELAHSLGLSVVAEGVEDQATLTQLDTLACDMAQGYCISRPLPAEEFKGWWTQKARH